MNPTELTASEVSSREPFTLDPMDSSANGTSFSNVGRNRKVLVVDDNVVVLKAFDARLKACGFEVLLTKESASAVATARTHKPDLIVLDINFPPEEGFSSLQWNGLNVLQWLKRFQEVSKIPVVVVSADAAAKREKEVLDAGAAAYFQKPVNFQKFVGALQPLLEAKPDGMPSHEI